MKGGKRCKRRNIQNWRPLSIILIRKIHFVKTVGIRSYSRPCLPAFGLNTERYSISLRIQSKCGNMRTRITPNKDTFCAVKYKNHSFITVHSFIFSHLFVKIFCSKEFESKCKVNNFFLLTHSP